MPSVGPALPPSLQQKRKRDGESEGTNSKPSSSRSSSDADGTKKQRILGPSLPPAPLEQMPEPPPGQSSRNPQNDSSSDESDFGPAPGPPAESSETVHTTQQGTEVTEAESTSEPRKPQREEWMLAPPTHGDWTSRVDPTKLRNRKFNTGKGARTPNQSNSTDNRLWTETPEQKKQRLEDEVLGKKKMAQMDSGPQRPMRNEAEDRETEKRIREYNGTNRSSSLYQVHKKKPDQTQEDDPSKRAFDKEKDIGGSGINFSKRREMVNKAADFGSRFSKGSYL